MSIELRKTKEEEKSSSFSMDIAMPDLRTNSTAIKIDTKSSMEKVKEKKIAKKKPEKKLFYELLEETWHKGILNRSHTSSESPDNSKCYYCPICCVCEILGIIPEIRKNNKSRYSNPYTHEEMVNLLREKCKFIDGRVGVNPGYNAFSGNRIFHEENEPMLAFNLASTLSGQMTNLEIAHAIKEQLYDNKKPKALPKEKYMRVLGSEDVFEPTGSLFTSRPRWITASTTRLPGLGIKKDLELDYDHKD